MGKKRQMARVLRKQGMRRGAAKRTARNIHRSQRGRGRRRHSQQVRGVTIYTQGARTLGKLF